MLGLSAVLPPVETQQHSLNSYDQFLSFSRDNNDTDDNASAKQGADASANSPRQQPIPAVARPTQTAQAHQHAYPLGSYREPSLAAVMVLCTVFIDLVRARGK